MSNEFKKELVDSAKSVSSFFEVIVEIRVFGQLIWSFVFPPKKNSKL